MATVDSLLERCEFEPTTGCWLWIGTVCGRYAQVRHQGVRRVAHRLMYEFVVGEIPKGLELDHVCRVTTCINPRHLEPVTPKENTRRYHAVATTHCPSGHEDTNENTGHGTQRDGQHAQRWCKACHRIRQAERRSAVKDTLRGMEGM